MDDSINLRPFIWRSIVPAYISFAIGAVVRIGFGGVTQQAGHMLLIVGAVWSGIQTIGILTLRAEAKRRLAKALSPKGSVNVMYLSYSDSLLSTVYGWLFYQINSVFIGVTVGVIAVTLIVAPSGFSQSLATIVRNRFLFTSAVLLPTSIVTAHLGIMITKTKKTLPNYATVFAAVFGTLSVLYTMYEMG